MHLLGFDFELHGVIFVLIRSGVKKSLLSYALSVGVTGRQMVRGKKIAQIV